MHPKLISFNSASVFSIKYKQDKRNWGVFIFELAFISRNSTAAVREFKYSNSITAVRDFE